MMKEGNLNWFLVMQLTFLLITPSNSQASSSSNHKLFNINPIREITDSIGVNGSNTYAVVFDAGSTGSRVHVFRFDQNLDLVSIDGEMEFFKKITPGLSSYGANSVGAANSLVPLLEDAKAVVPESLHASTPVKLGATAGLRLLPSDQADKIILAVRELMEKESPFLYKDGYVAILSGTQEGSYMWVAVNYLLENLGNPYSETVGIVDLGGGSVQMSYAISKGAAARAPEVEDKDNPYVKTMTLKGKEYNVYAHSYLNYGLLAARGEILKIRNISSPCILAGYNGTYKYGETVYPVSSPPSGASMGKCRKVILKSLKIDAPCAHPKCTFGGAWNGGGGPGQKHLYVASSFYNTATQAKIINSSQSVAQVRPVDFKKVAQRACRLGYEEAKSAFPDVWNEEFLCMDLVYEYTLLVDGFGLNPYQWITLVDKIEYQSSSVEAAWPLGSAVDVISTLTNKKSLYSLGFEAF